MPTIASLSVMLTANPAGFVGGLTLAEKSVARFKGKIETELTNAGSSINGMLGTVGTLATGFAAVGAVKWGVEVAAQAEQSLTTLETMLGSGDKAKAMFTDLQKLAAKTALTQQDLMKGSTMLLTGGFNEKDILPILTLLTDAASANPAGMSQGFEQLSKALADIKVKGKLAGEEAKQLRNAMIPVADILAKKFGRTAADVEKMIADGSVDAATAITSVLEYSQTRFAGLAAKQSTTLGGLWTTLKDDVGNALGDISAELVKSLNVKEGMQGMSAWFVDLRANTKEIAAVLGSVIGAALESGNAVKDVLVAIGSSLVSELPGGFNTATDASRTWRNATVDNVERVLGSLAMVVDFMKLLPTATQAGFSKFEINAGRGINVIEHKLLTTFKDNPWMFGIGGALVKEFAGGWIDERIEFQKRFEKKWGPQAENVQGDFDKKLNDLRNGLGATTQSVTNFFGVFRQKDAIRDASRLIDVWQASLQVLFRSGPEAAGFWRSLAGKDFGKIVVANLELAKDSLPPLDAAIRKLSESLLDELNHVGMTSYEWERAVLVSQGATADMLEQADALHRLVEERKQFNDLLQGAEKLHEQVNPLAKLQGEFVKLQAQVQAGKISITDYHLAVANLGDELLRLADIQQPKSAAAVLAGSTEAYSIAVQHQMPQQSQAERLQAAVVKLQEKMQMQNKIGEQILDAIKDGKLAVVPKF